MTGIDENNEENNKKKTRQEQAISDAKEIDLIENVKIQSVTMQMTFRALMMGLENGDYVIPRFQRMYRWGEAQVEELAISLVRGLPIPPIYCYRNSENQIVILDGQQRLISLYLYYIGKVLKRQRNAFIDVRQEENGKSFKDYMDSCELKDKDFYMHFQSEDGTDNIISINYRELSDKVKRQIDFVPLTLIEIIVDSDKYRAQMMHKIFANLNIGGIPLSTQELRNGIYTSRFYDMLYEINDTNEKWRKLYNGKSSLEVNKEGKDVELLLQMCAFRYYMAFQDGEFVLHNYKGKVSTLLDNFSEEALKFDDTIVDEYRKSIESFLLNIQSISGKNKVLSMVSFFVAWDHMDKKILITRDIYEEIISSSKYSSTIASGTTAKTVIEKRIRCVYEQLLRYCE